jgi:hypothetical protein
MMPTKEDGGQREQGKKPIAAPPARSHVFSGNPVDLVPALKAPDMSVEISLDIKT